MLGFGGILSMPPVSVIESPPVLLQCTSELIRSIVCTPTSPLSSGGELNLLPNFQKGGGLTDLNFERWVAGKEGGNFFQEGLQFYKKKKKTKI